MSRLLELGWLSLDRSCRQSADRAPRRHQLGVFASAYPSWEHAHADRARAGPVRRCFGAPGLVALRMKRVDGCDASRTAPVSDDPAGLRHRGGCVLLRSPAGDARYPRFQRPPLLRLRTASSTRNALHRRAHLGGHASHHLSRTRQPFAETHHPPQPRVEDNTIKLPVGPGASVVRRRCLAAGIGLASIALMATSGAAGTWAPLAAAPAHATAASGDSADCRSLTTCYTPRRLEAAYGILPLLEHGTTGRGETVVLPELAEPQFSQPATSARTWPNSTSCSGYPPPTSGSSAASPLQHRHGWPTAKSCWTPRWST